MSNHIERPAHLPHTLRVDSHEPANHQIDEDGVGAGKKQPVVASGGLKGTIAFSRKDAVDYAEVAPLGCLVNTSRFVGVPSNLVQIENCPPERIVSVPTSRHHLAQVRRLARHREPKGHAPDRSDGLVDHRVPGLEAVDSITLQFLDWMADSKLISPRGRTTLPIVGQIALVTTDRQSVV